MRRSTGVAALCVGSLLALAAVTPAHAAPPDWLPAVPDSATLSGSPLISGTVVAPDGTAFAEGTPVELVAYPSAEVVASLAVGDTIQTTPVAKGFVGDDGSFTIRLADSALDRFASKSGTVDFEVRIIQDDLYAPYSFSRTLAEMGNAAKRTVAASAFAPVSITSLAPSDSVARIEQAKAGPLQKTDICGETLVTNLGSKAVIVGGTYTGGAGRTGKLVYTSGSSSDLGVGYSVSGSYGSFSQSGSYARSSSSSVDFGTRTGGNLYTTYFVYGKYAQYCYPVGSTYDPSDIYAYKVHASSYAGGSAVAGITVPTTVASNCVSLASGTQFTKVSTSAYTWSTGASLSSSIGVNLSSKTGYTSSTSLLYSNTSGSSKQICGTNGLPGGTPGRVVLK